MSTVEFPILYGTVYGPLFILCLSWLVAMAWVVVPSAIEHPNGPKPWPIIGNLAFFSRLLKSPDRELMTLAKKYGGLCWLWFGTYPVLIISKAEDAKLLLDKVCPTV